MIEQGRPIDWQMVVARQWPVALPTLLLAAVCAGHFLGIFRDDYGGYLSMFAWARTVEWTGLLSFPYRDVGFGALLFLFAKILPSSDALWFFLIALLGLGVLLPLLVWRNWFGFSPPARFTVPLGPLLGIAAALRVSAGRGLARWRWGLVAAGVALAPCGPVVFTEISFLGEGLLLFLVMASFWMSNSSSALSGGLLGAAVAGRGMPYRFSRGAPGGCLQAARGGHGRGCRDSG
mgnify:CR=1 FL=1